MSQGEEKELAVRLGETFEGYVRASQRASQLYGQLLETYRQAKENKEELEEIAGKSDIELNISGLLDGELDEALRGKLEGETYPEEASGSETSAAETAGEKESDSKEKEAEIDYEQCADVAVEIIDNNPGKRFKASELIPDICEELPYEPEDLKSRTLGYFLGNHAEEGLIDKEKEGKGYPREYFAIETPENEATTETESETAAEEVEVDYEQCADVAVEIIDNNPGKRFKAGDLISKVCQDLPYDPDNILNHVVSRYLGNYAGEGVISKENLGEGQATEYFALETTSDEEVSQSEKEMEEEAELTDEQVLLALEDLGRSARPGGLIKVSEQLEGYSATAVDAKLESLTEAGLVKETEDGYDLANDQKADETEPKKKRAGDGNEKRIDVQ